jgi:hypothetical protein
MAVRLPWRTTWRSMQLAATLSVPSSNHLIETFPGSKDVFLMTVGRLTQLSRRLCSFQNESGFWIATSSVSR